MKEAISGLGSVPGLDGIKAPKIFTHAEFIDLVEKNRVKCGTGSTGWREEE